MGGKRSFELTLFFLLIVALCSEAQLQYKFYSERTKKLNWIAARSYCQKKYTDMLSWSTVSPNALAPGLRSTGRDRFWVGVHRDPEQASAFRGINLKTGEGISGDDLSQSSYWSSLHQKGDPCGYVSTNGWWYSTKCHSSLPFYCTNVDTIQFHNTSVTWDKALTECENTFSVLSTMTESNRLSFNHSGWIGLFREAGKNWRWVDNSTYTDSNWANGQSLDADCVSLQPFRKSWYTYKCWREYNFICYNDNLVLVKESKTWEDALAHCREMDTSCVDDENHPTHCYDLLSLTNPSHYGYIADKIYRATTDEVWIGLRFLAGEWWWLNGERPEDQEMLPNCPPQWKHCGSFSKHNNGSVNDQQFLNIKDCSERRNFICQKSGKEWRENRLFYWRK